MRNTNSLKQTPPPGLLTSKSKDLVVDPDRAKLTDEISSKRMWTGATLVINDHNNQDFLHAFNYNNSYITTSTTTTTAITTTITTTNTHSSRGSST
ncbi:hypothetical protein E2C01_020225 [Portunus trituberculatus]|uniref:Uncharacterized protein n=1 Tax=Portunus trituberculatus TaxID=210409 RepID=A0A5B7DZK5_PORTR|nr:hypothetical protein [Portunus trituberculatus]